MAKAAATSRSKPWTKDDIRELKKTYRNTRTKDVAEQLGRSEGSVQAKAKSLGLTKTKKYLKSIGRG